MRKEHAAAHDVLLCIQTGAKINDENRMRYPGPEFYLKTTEEMAALFKRRARGARHHAGDRRQVRPQDRARRKQISRLHRAGGRDARGLSAQRLCYEGLERRFGERAKEPELRERLDFELGRPRTRPASPATSSSSGISSTTRRRTTFPVGPGRGSAAGSLISYVLGITDLDPLKYGLFFERFLNPERISPPDIDVDFCYNRRPEVIDYVRKKYGEKSVAQIITFGTLGAKMAIRDVGRVMGLSYGEADRLTKMIPFDPKMTLEKALDGEPRFQARLRRGGDRRARSSTRRMTLEGVSRQAGVHAAGVVISDHDLTDYVPLTQGRSRRHRHAVLDGAARRTRPAQDGLPRPENADRHPGRAQADRADHRQENDAARNSARRSRRLRADEPRAKHRPVPGGIGAACARRCRQIQPRCVEDIIAIGALFRPGPMEFIPLYADRKSGKVPTEYDHPLLEPILKETYGIMVYQEQVMQAAQILAGYTLGGADMLRRAMGKKKPEEMAKQRAIFVEGCAKKNKIGETKANQLFDVLDKFAGYGFNKAHAACYGVITCQTAWLKARHPVEFMAALLSNELDNTDKIALFVAEAKRDGHHGARRRA